MSLSGLYHERHFCPASTNPYDTVDWKEYDAVIENPMTGETVFEQKGVIFPESWSQQSVNIVSSKYFFGDLDEENGSPANGKREYSLKQLIDRVADTIVSEGNKRGYFTIHEDAESYRADMKWLLLHQYFAFNSPVWFNVGLGQEYGEKEGDEQNLLYNEPEAGEGAEEVDPYMAPQAAACFIIDLPDDIDGIWDAMKESARLFKFGSGVGADWSTLRSSKERVSGGGTASGPVPFMRVQDATGATIKSGGKTRRAAIMQILRTDHPDIWEFVDVKRDEEKKAHALIEQGYDASFNGEAYQTADFQDVNMSVRIDDEFFEAVNNEEHYSTRKVTTGEKHEDIYAPELMEAIAQNTHECGDPGVQYDGAIQNWHTCPEAGRINGSNPCSEFLHMDNTACNLASMNLRKFEKEDGGWDAESLAQASEIAFMGQEILAEIAGYPSPEIAEKSERFRPLGLGFANLGATLMAHGIPYDSDEGRAIAAGLQSIIHFSGYNRSTKMAEVLEPFDGYEANKEPFNEVMDQHQDAVYDMMMENHHLSDVLSVSDRAQELLKAGYNISQEMNQRGRDAGYRNSQATVIAPTGTISFYMGCTTTGIEPSPALVQYKNLAGEDDSQIKIVNDVVEEGLEALGYSGVNIQKIRAHIENNDTIEGAPYIQEEDLAVFDCAMPPANGERSIHHHGHIDMMATVQPFVSGAISKTVNMPSDATVQEIEDAYVRGWEQGLKALAIYRDGSKGSQPVSTTDGSEEEESDAEEEDIETLAEQIFPSMASDDAEASEEMDEETNSYEAAIDRIKTSLNEGEVGPLDVIDQLAIGLDKVYNDSDKQRRKLPDQTPSIRRKFRVGGTEGYIHVGMYPDTREPGEVFITVSKEGSTLAGVMDSFATSLSLALQYGVPLEDLVSKFKNQRFEPSGFTGDDIQSATSIVDYLAQFLEEQFLTSEDEEQSSTEKAKPYDKESDEDVWDWGQGGSTSDPEDIEEPEYWPERSMKAAKARHSGDASEQICEKCGSMMQQDGTCYVCPVCGEDTGCGG